MSAPVHEPVLLAETMALLQPSRGGVFVDCTVGLGGHARAILDGGATRLIGLDRRDLRRADSDGSARGSLQTGDQTN